MAPRGALRSRRNASIAAWPACHSGSGGMLTTASSVSSAITPSMSSRSNASANRADELALGA